eukprot:1160179-Pelagomonas_calceolata.AAC.1
MGKKRVVFAVPAYDGSLAEAKKYLLPNQARTIMPARKGNNTREQGLSQDKNIEILGIHMVNGVQTGRSVGDVEV